MNKKADRDMGTIHPFLMRYATWGEDFEDVAPYKNIELREVNPAVQDYVEAGNYFTQQDIKFLTERLELDIDPWNRTEFYASYLNIVEDFPWVACAIESMVASNRLGKKRGVRLEVIRRKQAIIRSKMPSIKFSLRLMQDAENRMRELVDIDPAPVDLLVGAFFENATNHFAAVSKEFEAQSLDGVVDEALGLGKHSGRDVHDYIAKTTAECGHTNYWLSIAERIEVEFNEVIDSDKEEIAAFKDWVNEVIGKLANSLDGSSLPDDYLALSQIADIGVELEAGGASEKLFRTMENLRVFLADFGKITWSEGALEALTDARLALVTSHIGDIMGFIGGCSTRRDALDAKISEATEARRFDELGTLAQEAGDAEKGLQDSQRLLQRIRELIGRLINDDTAEIENDLVDLSASLLLWLGEYESRDKKEEAEITTDDPETLEIEKGEINPFKEVEDLGSNDLRLGDKYRLAVAATGGADGVPASSGEALEDQPEDDLAPVVDQKPTSEMDDEVEDSPEILENTQIIDEHNADVEIDFSGELNVEDNSVAPAFLGGLLRQDLTGAAADFAAVLEGEGFPWPIEASVLRVAAAGRARLGDSSPDSQTFVSTSQHAFSKVKTDHGHAILLGALLRPALVQKSRSLRANFSVLAQGYLGSHLKDVVHAIEKLDFDFPPSARVLAKISGAQLEPPEKRLSKNLTEWVDTISRKRSRWELTTAFMQHTVSRNGLIGQAVEAINSGEPNARALAQECIDRLATTALIENEATENAIENGRHKISIPARAQEYLLRTFSEANQMLSEWIAVASHKESQSERSAERFKTVVATLKTRLETAKRSIAAEADENNMTGSVATWLCLRLDDALAALRGEEMGRFATVETALTSDRNLMDSAMRRDLEEGEATADDISFLVEDGLSSPEDAFAEACDGGSFEVASELARQYQLATKAEFSSAIEKFTTEWAAKVLDKQRTLKSLSKVDYSHQVEIGRYLHWCSNTLDRLGGVAGHTELDNLDDVPSYVGVLEDNLRDIEKTIRSGQIDRVISYQTDANLDEVEELLSAAKDLPIEAVEDRIAQLRDGRSTAAFDAELEGVVGIFMKDFLPFASSPDWPVGPRQFVDALEKDGLCFVEHARREAASSLFSQYISLCSTIPKGAPSSEKVKTLFEEIGFQDVRVKAASKIGGTKSWNMSMDAQIVEGDWFLPPTFGSKATSGYGLVLVAQDTLPEALIQSLSLNKPCFLLLAGVANVERRREFAQHLRERAIPAVLIDEALIAFAAIRREMRISTIFDCGLPFGRVESYTTDAGQIPPEMFFGRTSEIRDIMSITADGCLVYGGRQLGKSALLNYIERQYHDPANDVVVVRREVKPLGNAEKTTKIWAHLNAMLSQDGVVKVESRTADSICRDVRAWLHERPSGQIVCMFDETDHFMTVETKEDYPQLSRLKELMEDSERRFKVIFAGLHNVQRVLRQPNSPLAHLGRAICVGPLNLTADDKRAAYDLIIRPMRAAGFRFENVEAVEEILAWTNFFPSLSQEYGKGLLSSLHGSGSGRSYKLPDGSPLWTIPKASLFDNSEFGEIENRVREKFHLTLDLDPRYAIVAYTLASLNADGFEQQALVSGFKPKEILDSAQSFWPLNSVVPSSREFDALLEEMVGMGVLGRIKTPDSQRFKYLLRTRQVAAMLGSREDVDHALLELADKEPSVSYDRTIHRRRYDPAGKHVSAAHKRLPYSPLTDFAIERLLDREEYGVKIVCGLKALGLSKIPVAFSRIFDGSSLPGMIKSAMEVSELNSEKEIRGLFDKSKKSDEISKILLHTPENAEDAYKKIEWMGRQEAVLDGRIRPFILLNAGDEGLRSLAIRFGDGAEFLTAWGAETLRIHLNNLERSELDTSEMRKRILEATGGIPMDVINLVADLSERADNIDAVFEEWERSRFDIAENLDEVLTAAVPLLENTKSKEEFLFLDELLRDETNADLLTLGPDLHAIGVLSKWDPKNFLLGLSSLGQLAVDTINKLDKSA
ncbi:hypothetical protein [Octadecabacter antarcticus]|nr:hypothetical protein [Octadecabacter antarcticus]